MATRKASSGDTPRKTTKRASKSTARPASAAQGGGGASAFSAEAFSPSALQGASAKQLAEMSRMANLMTPQQAIELYKANAKLALDVINAAIDSTAKLRKLQYEGEETAREFGRRTAKGAAEARDPQSLAALGQEAGREALEKSLAYWSEMFELIAEMQRRLFTLMSEQGQDLPGFSNAQAAMAMMPDLSPMKNVVNAMQGMIGSGTGAFSSMQKMMADMARLAQSNMPGSNR